MQQDAGAISRHGADHCFALFDAAAHELLLRHNVLPDQLLDRMKAMLLAASDGRPKALVLYGGEDSPAFENFKDATCHVPSLASLCLLTRIPCASDRPRLTDACLMAPFGRQVAADWPLVGAMAKAYVRHRLGAHFHQARTLISDVAQILSLEVKVAMLAKVDASPDPGGDDQAGPHWSAALSKSTLVHYTPAALKTLLLQQAAAGLLWPRAALDEMAFLLVDELEAARASEAVTRCGLVQAHGQRFCDAMLASVAHPYPADDPRRKSGRYTPLSRALKEYSEADWHVWNCQGVFDVDAMRHLLRCRDHLAHLLAAPGLALQSGSTPSALSWEAQLGLCAASSSADASYRICEVPQLAVWRVHASYTEQEMLRF